MSLNIRVIVLVLGVSCMNGIGHASFPLGDLRNPAQSCWEILSKAESKTSPQSGVYWFRRGEQCSYSPPYYSGGLFQAYCDMTTEGGGWTLIARITDDYSWICPDKKGRPCHGSGTTAPPSHGNLWHDVHSRLFIKPEFVPVGSDSGVHLPRADVRRLFENGLHSVRFSFYEGTDLTGVPANDAVASFFQPQELFQDDTELSLFKGQHYEFRVLRHANSSRTTFRGNRICWLSSDAKRSGYEGGLFLGTSDGITSCHLDNNVGEVMLKSHYVAGNGKAWYGGQYGFLRASTLQVPHDAIMLWVR